MWCCFTCMGGIGREAHSWSLLGFFLFHRVFTLMVSLSSFPEQNELPKTGMIKWFAWGPMAIGSIVTVQTTVWKLWGSYSSLGWGWRAWKLTQIHITSINGSLSSFPFRLSWGFPTYPRNDVFLPEIKLMLTAAFDPAWIGTLLGDPVGLADRWHFCILF